MACIYPLDLFLCYLPDTFQLARSFLFSSCCHWQVMCFYPGLHRAQDPSVAWSFISAINSSLSTNVFLLKGSSMHVRKCWLWLPCNMIWPNLPRLWFCSDTKPSSLISHVFFHHMRILTWWQDGTWPVKTFTSYYFDCVLEKDHKNDTVLILNHETRGRKPVVFNQLPIAPGSWMPLKLLHSSLGEKWLRSFWGSRLFLAIGSGGKFLSSHAVSHPTSARAWWRQESKAQHLCSSGCIWQQSFPSTAKPWTIPSNIQIK